MAEIENMLLTAGHDFDCLKQPVQIKATTQSVLFTVYAPPGISPGMVLHHLETIRDNVLVVSPDGQVELLHVFGAV